MAFPLYVRFPNIGSTKQSNTHTLPTCASKISDKSETRRERHVLGSVLVQMAFPLHASEISDKSETEKEKHVSVQAESSHFFPFKKGLYWRGQNVTFFRKDVTKNVTSLKKNSCARASHSSQKCDKCDASHFLSLKKVTNATSLTQI